LTPLSKKKMEYFHDLGEITFYKIAWGGGELIF
jgi:hypothetical protein